MVVELTGVKVPVNFGDSRSNRSRDIGLRLPHFITDDDNDDDRSSLTIWQNAALPKNEVMEFADDTVWHCHG